MNAAGRIADGEPRVDPYRRWKRWYQRQNPALLAALAFSLALHLSAVTIFSIGVWFPREDRLYHRFDIIDTRTGQAFRFDRIGEGEALSDAIFGDDSLVIPSLRERLAGLPAVELPSVDVKELGEIRLRRAELHSLSRVESVRKERHDQRWYGLDEGIGRISETLSNLNPFDPVDPDEEKPESSRGPIQLAEPAPGFEAYIDWLSGDTSRRAIYAPSLDALNDAFDDELSRPLSFVIEVDADGRVQDALAPLSSDAAFIAPLSDQIRRYRFEPLSDSDGARVQHGTLVISRVEVAP